MDDLQWFQQVGQQQEEQCCPDCGSDDVWDGYHEGSFAVPECSYKECGKCRHQWDHQ